MFKILPMCGCQKLSLSGNRRKSFFHFFLSFQRGCSIWIWKEKEKVPRILQKCRGQTSHQITHLFVVMDQNHDWVKNNVNIEAAMSMGGTTTHQDRRSNKCKQHEYMSSHASNLRLHLKTHSGEKQYKCNQCDYACSHVGNLRRHFKTHSVKQMQSVWLCILSGRHFEDTFKNIQWRKAKQMQQL